MNFAASRAQAAASRFRPVLFNPPPTHTPKPATPPLCSPRRNARGKGMARLGVLEVLALATAWQTQAEGGWKD